MPCLDYINPKVEPIRRVLMPLAVFDPAFLEDLHCRTRTDRRRALRTLKLVEAILRDPFGGMGKPERLRGELAGRWSRRIDTEHRLVYQVSGERVYFLAARYHY